MTFKLEINMDNAAFDNPDELSWILHRISEYANKRDYQNNDIVRDSNGNTVGRWEIK